MSVTASSPSGTWAPRAQTFPSCLSQEEAPRSAPQGQRGGSGLGGHKPPSSPLLSPPPPPPSLLFPGWGPPAGGGGGGVGRCPALSPCTGALHSRLRLKLPLRTFDSGLI